MRGILSAMTSCSASLVVISPPCHLVRHSDPSGLGGWWRQIGSASSLTLPQGLLSWSPRFFVQDALYSQTPRTACSCDCPGMGGGSTNLPDESARIPYLSTYSQQFCCEAGCLLSSTQGCELQAFSVVKLAVYLEFHYPKPSRLKEPPIK